MESLKANQVAPRERVSYSLTAVLIGLLVSLRPHQWIKNILLLSGLVFSGSLFKGESVGRALQAFILFCFASSGIYLFNDLRDLRADRAHPVKRHRPIAAGRVAMPLAIITMLALLTGALIGSLQLSRPFALILGGYLVMNVAYSLGLKHVVILDVILVAMGFVLRAVAGAVVVNVTPSHWLILCTLMLALLVVSGKRRYDVVLAQGRADIQSPPREWYTVEFLDLMTAIAGGAAIVMYALYTLSAETITRFGSRGMMLTVPFVLYGIFRYLFLMHRQSGNGDPALLFLTDRPTMLNTILWGVTVCAVLYGIHW